MTASVCLDKAVDLAGIERLCHFEGPCVSIYLTGHHPGAGTRPQDVRLSTLLRDMEHSLRQRGLADADIGPLLAPVYELAGTEDFAEGENMSFVLFRSPRMMEGHRLPGVTRRWKDTAVAGNRFLITPLLEHMKATRPFHLLDVNRQNMRLLRVNGGEIVEVPLPPGVPGSFEESLGTDSHGVNHRTGQMSAGGTGKVGFGTSTDREKQRRFYQEYCKEVERGMRPLLDTAGLPLVLAGMEFETAAYRAVNTYPMLVEESVPLSSRGGAQDRPMAVRARTMLKRWLSPEEKRVAHQLDRQAGTAQTSSKLEETVRAAWEGRVQDLFFTVELHQMGDFDKVVGRVPHAGEAQFAEEDMINAAVVETLRRSGKAFLVPREFMPDGTGMAALLRYG
jgi:hypothetical protein